MTFKRAIYASTLAAGVGLAGLVGVGLGTAAVRLRWTGSTGASTRGAVTTSPSIGTASR